MKHRAFTRLELVIVCAVLAILAMVALAVFSRENRSAPRSGCQSHLKQIGLGVLQYTQDYSEKLPLVMNGDGQGWGEMLQPYLKTTQIFLCPLNRSEQRNGEFLIDYFSNLRLSGLSTEKMKFQAQIIWGGDGDFDSPTWISIAGLPPKWAPSTRHLEGANYLFVDGHVKWLKPENIGKGAPNSKKFTFEPK